MTDNVTRDEAQVPALLSAVMAIGSDLDLPTVLRSIVETAVKLVDCEYGALGVIGEEYAGAGTGPAGKVLAEFVTTGIDDVARAEIGTPPHGDGILGLLVRQPRVLRLGDLSEHPDSVGFPPGHPPMKTFLGVPVRVRDEVFGNLYLTEKRGHGYFTDADEQVVLTLAVAAGVAIENARLYGESRRAVDWQQAMAEINRALLVGSDTGEVLQLVAFWAARLANADVAAIGFANDHGALVVEVAEGPSGVDLVGTPLPLPDPCLSVPLGWRSAAAALSVANLDPENRFEPDTVAALQGFAGQAVLALELAEARRDSERLLVFEDRDRIARDLHDSVVQQLFAAGMQLEAVSRQTADPALTERINKVIDDLDGTIHDIRSTIYSLKTTQRDRGFGLRVRIAGLAEQLSSILGFAPTVRVSGPIDSLVPDDLANEVIAVLRESMSNIAKHAQAHRVLVEIDVADDQLSLVVRDDGVGLPAAGERSAERTPGRGNGLVNLAGRAQKCGGAFQAVSDPNRPDGWSTMVTWEVPLPHAD